MNRTNLILFSSILCFQLLGISVWGASIEVLRDEGAIVIRDNNADGKVISNIPVKTRQEADKIYEEQVRSRKLNKGESADFEPLNPRLEFHDTNGKTFKTISLETDSKIIPRKTEEKIIKSKYLTEKAVITSNDKQYALLSIFTGFSADIDEKGNEQLYYDRVSTCKLEFYDANGVLLWEKQMPEGVSCGDAKFSDNGEIIYVPVGLAETTYTAHIYNKKGDLLLNVPWGSEPVMSPNGKYLALRVAGNPTSTIFYNLENGKSWNPGKRLTIPINGFSNNGKVIVDDIKDKSSFVIDLKQYIGD